MEITWRSPSNIALIKYWGKHGNQLPNNASLSLTLSEAYSETSVELKNKRKKSTPDIDFYFEGKKNPAFAAKLIKYLDSIKSDFPFINDQKLVIRSENSFPHSSGIASSASSMSALALCLMSLQAGFSRKLLDYDAFLKNASFYARLGSGSASRSLYPAFSVWGETKSVKNSADTYAIPFPKEYHSNFNDLQDTILIVSDQEKSVSSRAGHELMKKHPSAELRYKNAGIRLHELIKVLRTGDFNVFVDIVEAEALELHALMMTSSPSFILMAPATLEIMQRIRNFRNETKIPVCFTLDAGPNVHILYPYFEKKAVRNFIQSELLKFCNNKKVIYDGMGAGPTQIITD